MINPQTGSEYTLHIKNVIKLSFKKNGKTRDFFSHIVFYLIKCTLKLLFKSPSFQRKISLLSNALLFPSILDNEEMVEIQLFM
jgi:hypothetical protein